MAFKHGRLGELWLNEVDISPYFASVAMDVKVAPADVSTFKTAGAASTYHSHLAGLAEATLTAAGFYDSAEADQVRETLQEVTVNVQAGGAGGLGQLTYMPAGALAIGDLARLLNINSSDYKTSSKVGSAVVMDWTAMSTAVVGAGSVLHVLQSEAVGTITGTGADLGNPNQTTTGAILHVHLTAKTGADTFDCKLQDSTTLGGAYADIAGGAITQMTALGSQRLVIPGTIRAYVKCVAVVAGHAMTYGVAAART